MDRGSQLISALWDMMNKKRALDLRGLKSLSGDLNPSELRCIDFIGRHDSVNATRLAEAFYLTTGAASKLTKKLLTKGLVTRYQKLENKKEIYFRLTEEGRGIFQVQDALLREFAQRDEPVFRSLTEEQFQTILDFTRSYISHLDRLSRR